MNTWSIPKFNANALSNVNFNVLSDANASSIDQHEIQCLSNVNALSALFLKLMQMYSLYGCVVCGYNIIPVVTKQSCQCVCGLPPLGAIRGSLKFHCMFEMLLHNGNYGGVQ